MGNKFKSSSPGGNGKATDRKQRQVWEVPIWAQLVEGARIIILGLQLLHKKNKQQEQKSAPLSLHLKIEEQKEAKYLGG